MASMKLIAVQRSTSTPATSFFTVSVKGEASVDKMNWYNLYLEDHQTWAKLPFSTKDQTLQFYEGETPEYHDACAAATIKKELGVYISEYEHKTIEVYKAQGVRDRPKIPIPQGSAYSDDDLVGSTAWIFIRTTHDPKSPDYEDTGRWPDYATLKQDESCGDKVQIFIQEKDDWCEITLPPKTTDVCNNPMRYNVVVLKKCIASSMKWADSESKESAMNIRVYRCKQGMAHGAPLKGNILINTNAAYLVALSPDTDVETWILAGGDDPRDNDPRDEMGAN